MSMEQLLVGEVMIDECVSQHHTITKTITIFSCHTITYTITIFSCVGRNVFRVFSSLGNKYTEKSVMNNVCASLCMIPSP